MTRREESSAAEREARLARSRNEYEQALRLNRRDLRQWMRYAAHEAAAGELTRASAVFERALAVDYTHVPLWLRYAQTLVLARCLDDAAGVLARACGLLPNEPKLWYTSLEILELRGNIDAARAVLAEWTRAAREPDEAFAASHAFALRHHEDALAVAVQWTERCPHSAAAWRARARHPRADADAVAQAAVAAGAPAAVLEQLAAGGAPVPAAGAPAYDGCDSGIWWAQLQHALPGLDFAQQSALYERALAQCRPRGPEKTDNDRIYALVALRYALAREQHGDDAAPTFEAALRAYPPEFTSCTLYTQYALYALRRGDLARARRVLGAAIGRTRGNGRQGPQVLRQYIDLETRLRSTDRVRQLYVRQCELWPNQARAWADFAAFEQRLQNPARARFLLDLAAQQPAMDDMLAVHEARADLAYDLDGATAARAVYEALLRASPPPPLVNRADAYAHLAIFELGLGKAGAARAALARGLRELAGERQLRLEMYDLCVLYEREHGTPATLRALESCEPQLEDGAYVFAARAPLPDADEAVYALYRRATTGGPDEEPALGETDDSAGGASANDDESSDDEMDSAQLAALAARAAQWKQAE